MSCQFDLESLGQLRKDYFNPANLMEREIPVKDLKPCPFCGKQVKMDINAWGDSYTASVHCKNCGATQSCFTDKSINKAKLRAVVAWNRRSYA